MSKRSVILVVLALCLSLAIAHAAVSQSADSLAEPQSANAPQRFVVFEAFMRYG